MECYNRKKWNDETIENAIYDVMRTAKINTFPTHSLIKSITGDNALTNAISRHGGTRHWAKKLGIEVKSCESLLGYEYECECMSYLTSQFGYNCELTKARYPYDIIVNRNIKVDVKCSHLCKSKAGNFYTFNLGKPNPTCDIFVCYCLNNNNIENIYIIPSCVVSGSTQLAIGYITSKYDRYIDNWTIFALYDDLYNQILQS